MIALAVGRMVPVDTYPVFRRMLESGLPLQAINFLPLPPAIPARPGMPAYGLQLGHGPASDVFNMLMRTALPDDQAAFDAYRQENPYYVLRVGPGTHLPPNLPGVTPNW